MTRVTGFEGSMGKMMKIAFFVLTLIYLLSVEALVVPGRRVVRGLSARSIGGRSNPPQGARSLEMMFGSMGSSSSKINVPKGKKLCVVTGTTSGLGKETARSLIESGEYFVICACRNVEKMEGVAEDMGFDTASYKVMELDLGSYDSTKKFAKNLKASKSKGLDALICNAAVYQPSLPEVRLVSPISLTYIFVLQSIFISLLLAGAETYSQSCIFDINNLDASRQNGLWMGMRNSFRLITSVTFSCVHFCCQR